MKEKDLILSRTTGGWDVFTHYLGDCCKKRVFCNPFRGDSSPSCSLTLYKDRYYMKDFGNEDWSGDCFHLVAMVEGLRIPDDFGKILRIIDRELDLFIYSDTPADFVSHRDTYIKPADQQPRVKSFVYEEKPFSRQESDFWQRYGIDDDVLAHYDVVSLKRCTFKREDNSTFTILSSVQHPMYAYCFQHPDHSIGLKLYRPGSKNRFMYAGCMPRPYIFGDCQLPSSGELLFVTGGEKDVMTLAAHGFSAVCFNSETARLPEDVIARYSRRFGRIILLFDMDETGIKSSRQRYEELSIDGNPYNLSELHLPLSGTKTDKDVSDYFAKGNTSVDFVRLIL